MAHGDCPRVPFNFNKINFLLSHGENFILIRLNLLAVTDMCLEAELTKIKG